MPKSILRNVNLRPEVFDLIQGECEVRRNGGKGFSLTLNQVVLEYFAMRTPKNIAVDGMTKYVEKEDGTTVTEFVPVATIDWDPARIQRDEKKYGPEKVTQ